MVCTASLISVFVALLFTWKTSVFWFSLMARPFSVITGRRMIWYADFITPPPPLFHAGCGDAEHAMFSFHSFPRHLLLPCVDVSKSNPSMKPAVSRLQVAKRLRDHNATSDTDKTSFNSPVPALQYSSYYASNCHSASYDTDPPARVRPP